MVTPKNLGDAPLEQTPSYDWSCSLAYIGCGQVMPYLLAVRIVQRTFGGVEPNAGSIGKAEREYEHKIAHS